jgi:hypothetical protein
MKNSRQPSHGFEFLSPGWIERLHAVAAEVGETTRHLPGLPFVMAEKYLNCPVRVTNRAYWMRFTEQGIEVGAGEIDSADAQLEIDYEFARSLSTVPMSDPRVAEATAGAASEGKIRGSESLASVPPQLMEALGNLHDRLAAVTVNET